VLPPTIFFAVSINFILLTVNLILLDYGVHFSSAILATAYALVVGKAVLLANQLPFLHRLDTAPIIQARVFQRRAGPTDGRAHHGRTARRNDGGTRRNAFPAARTRETRSAGTVQPAALKLADTGVKPCSTAPVCATHGLIGMRGALGVASSSQ
jgi:hypothetical protein